MTDSIIYVLSIQIKPFLICRLRYVATIRLLYCIVLLDCIQIRVRPGEVSLTFMGGRDASILTGANANGLLRIAIAGSTTARPNVWNCVSTTGTLALVASVAWMSGGRGPHHVELVNAGVLNNRGRRCLEENVSPCCGEGAAGNCQIRRHSRWLTTPLIWLPRILDTTADSREHLQAMDPRLVLHGIARARRRTPRHLPFS